MTDTLRHMRRCIARLWHAGRCASRITNCTGIPEKIVLATIQDIEGRRANGETRKTRAVIIPPTGE